jgi:L-iditol 2-dehydrogenase
MKAVQYDGPHQMRIVDLPEPTPGAGEVRLRVGACGICGSDVHGYTGESGRRTAGQVMGHEFAGAVDAIGGCGRCVYCQTGREQCCPDRKVIGVNTGKVGAFAEYVCVPAENLAAIDDRISYAAALLNEPLAVSFHALSHVPKEAKTLAIVGGGTIGQCLASVAKVLGRWKVVVLEPIEEKRKLAETNGAVALPPDLELLHKHFPGGADAAIEAVGVEKTVQFALDAVRPAGTLVLLGNLAKQVTLPLQHISSTEKHLVGSYGFSRDDFRKVVAWINEGKFDLEPLLTGTCTLDETPGVFEELATGRRQAVKIVVEP